jgi:hypothetical protein
VKRTIQFYSLILFPILVMASSWIRFISEKTLMVDGHQIQNSILRNSLVVLIGISFVIYMKSLWEILSGKLDIHKDDIYRISIFFLIVSFLTLPFFSNDFFSLLAYSDAFLLGNKIFSDPNCISDSQYISYVSPLYRTLICKYGPLMVLVDAVLMMIAKSNVWTNLLAFKAFYALMAFTYIRISLKIGGNEDNFGSKLLLLTPLWWLQGLGQIHNELIGVCFILAAIYQLQKSRIMLAYVLISLAILWKITFIFCFIIPLLYQIQTSNKIFTKEHILSLTKGILILLFFGLRFYFPLIDDYHEILAPFQGLASERPSSTWTDILAHGMLLFNSSFVDNYSQLIPKIKWVGMLLFVSAGIQYLKNYKSKMSAFLFISLVYCVVFFVYSHRFLPWYLMLFPLFLCHMRRLDWTKWLLLMVFASSFQDIALIADTNFLLGQILMVLSTVLTVLLTIYSLPSRVKYDD